MDLGVRYLIRETYLSSLDLAQHTLEALGLARADAVESIRRFDAHDKKQLQAQREIRDDEQKLIQSAQQAARELEQLFEADTSADAGARERREASQTRRARRLRLIAWMVRVYAACTRPSMAFSARGASSSRSITSSDGARRIVDQDLLDEARHAMLDLVDEAQLVGIDRLLAAGAVEIARLERHLVHEARQEPRLLERRQVLRNGGFRNRGSLRCGMISARASGMASARRRAVGPPRTRGITAGQTRRSG